MSSAGQRLTSVLEHLNPIPTGRNRLLRKHADDIVCGYRMSNAKIKTVCCTDVL
jgi:undecaprenyl pyrophosphate synthase